VNHVISTIISAVLLLGVIAYLFINNTDPETGKSLFRITVASIVVAILFVFFCYHVFK